MKIIGGQFKGRNFYMPDGIRPTQNITRKAIFDLLGHDLSDIVFLELFAGSGAVGLEAISRDAQKVTFVEKNEDFCEVIRGNLDILSIPLINKDRQAVYELIQSDAFASIKLFSVQGKKFDIVFADPPYGLGLAKKILKTLEAYDIVGPNSIVVIEHEKEEILPQSQGKLLRADQRKYGSTVLSIYKKTGDR